MSFGASPSSVRRLAVAAVTVGLVLPLAGTAWGDSTVTRDQARAVQDRGQSTYPASVRAGGTADAFPSGCGVRVDLPHPSYYTHYQIHTNVNSTCYVVPVISSSLRANTYRSRWYGWQGQTLLAPTSRYVTGRTAPSYNWTAAVSCTNGDRYRYRTEGFGTINTPTGSYSAAAYEQNDSEITCSY